MPKLSVIMPSLNVSPYIRECMDSVIHQTLEDMEILCVDAGSTDGTWEILEEYAREDTRIRLIRSPKKSYGYQMNLGMREATGEYIGIVETDDFIVPEMYEELYAYAKEKDADFVKGSFDLFISVGDEERFYLKYDLLLSSGVQYDTLYTSEDYVDGKLQVDVFIWNGIYRRAFLCDNHIQFQETPGAAFQDCGFRYQVALHVKRGFFLNKSYYRYRRDNSNSSTYNNKSVIFNLSECKNLFHLAERDGANQKQLRFLAREIAVIAHLPYIELLKWGEEAEGTKEALAGFGELLSDFIRKGLLSRDSYPIAKWVEIRMLVEDADLFDRYVHVQAHVMAQDIRDFLEKVKEKREVILFGSGMRGSNVYCLFWRNGIRNVMAFCDNAREKWGSVHMGCPIISPEEAAQRFPDAYFVIANKYNPVEIHDQLRGFGIAENQIVVFDLPVTQMDSTNIVPYLDA